MLNAYRHVTRVVFDHRGQICEEIKTSTKIGENDGVNDKERVVTESSVTMLRSDANQYYRVSNKSYAFA